MGISKNGLFPRLRRQLRAQSLSGLALFEMLQALMYFSCMLLYTAVFRAALPCTHEKILVFRGARMLPFIHLHVHSNYSTLAGVSSLEDLCVTAHAQGADTLALTDTNGLVWCDSICGSGKANRTEAHIGN